MEPYALTNPVFSAFLVAAALMILKLMLQGWITVYRMIRADAGLLNPEDLIPGPANRAPRPEQLQPNDYVERSRRVQRNDLESIPAFLAAGMLYVAIRPLPALAITLFAIFVVARLAHTLAYMTGQRHEIRATLFSLGSIVVVVMAVQILIAGLTAG